VGNAGGVYFAGFSGIQSAVFSDLQVLDNKANTRGGGLYIFDASPEIDQVVALNNLAGSDGGGAWIGVFQRFVNATKISRSQFSNNQVTSGLGGGVWLHAESLAAPELSEVTLNGNLALSGGGLYVEYKIDQNALLLSDSQFSSNVATNYGGGTPWCTSLSALILL